MSLVSSIPLVASQGCVLSVAQKAAMQASLPLLKHNYRFSQVLFFGKLFGKTADYARALGEDVEATSFVMGVRAFF